MGRLICFIILALVYGGSEAQDSIQRLRLVQMIPGDYTSFSVDLPGNIYVIRNGTELKKLNREGDSVAVFSDTRRYGKIHSLDVSNPLRVVVFFRTSSTVLVLDRLLAVKSVIDLRKCGIARPRAVSGSYDNQLWVFDEMDNQLKKIDERGKLLNATADLRTVFPSPPVFEFIIDDNRSVYLYDSTRGWYVFDYYGAFIRSYPFTGWSDVQVVNGRMSGRSDSCILSASTGSLVYAKAWCSAALAFAREVQVKERLLFILNSERLEVYAAP
ncbi:MAG TPA: hypothetical protein VF145_09880 [Chitinophagaceae bacterium]